MLDHALRPLFAYLGALVVPTAVYAASEDWGTTDGDETGLAARIARAGRELATAMASMPRPPVVDAFDAPPDFASLLQDEERPCPAPAAWGDTRVALPAGLSASLLDQLTGRPAPTPSGALALADALAELPVALLIAD